MSILVSKVLEDADAKMLTLSACIELLERSERETSNYNDETGHPLQHSARQEKTDLMSQRVLKDAYHYRGGITPEGKMATKIEAKRVYRGSGAGGRNSGGWEVVAVDVGSPHSMFLDDTQAAACLRYSLQSRGGIYALNVLLNNPEASVSLCVGYGDGTFFEQRTQMNAVPTEWVPKKNDPSTLALRPRGKPTEAQLNSSENFVLITPRSIGSIRSILRADGPRGFLRLHVQTCYADAAALKPGAARVECKNAAALDLSFIKYE